MSSTDSKGRSLRGRLTFTAMGLQKGDVYNRWENHQGCGTLILNLENAQQSDLGRYVLGMYISLREITILGHMELKDILTKPTLTPNTTAGTSPPSVLKTVVREVLPFSLMSYKDLLAIETGSLIRQNLWLEWVRYTAHSANETTGCIVCTGARPHLGTVPLEVPKDDLECVIGMYTNKSTTNCSDYAPLFHTKPSKHPADIVITKGTTHVYRTPGEVNKWEIFAKDSATRS
ncbi:hypothetical protein PRIEUP_LOCUS1918 [Pristimantis euphronides]